MSIVSEKCAWCNGTGKEPEYKMEGVNCKVCKGGGKVKVQQNENFESIKCENCNNTGRDNEGKFYFSCSGSGWVGFVKEI